MLTQSTSPLLSLLKRSKTIPVVETRMQFAQVFDSPHVLAVLLRHCNLFEFKALLEQAHRRKLAIYVNADHIHGIHADAAGLRYLADQFHIAGVVSNHPKILALASSFGLETIQRIFAVDSTGLEIALESIDSDHTDLLEISPALVIPHVIPGLSSPLPLPFIGSGLIQTTQQIQAILRANAAGVIVERSALWRNQLAGDEQSLSSLSAH
ncbi:MAG TPA: glycerol-3-phosphate responsive antiterminator [Ktedonobacterales bacterium]|nr:glycerol-3-phosphate responsive antiterminator [Ktedonobacterales bacterium]